jgi:hypothetical protein
MLLANKNLNTYRTIPAKKAQWLLDPVSRVNKSDRFRVTFVLDQCHPIPFRLVAEIMPFFRGVIGLVFHPDN